GVTAIAAASGHTVALKSDGTLVAWGYNYFGEVTGTPTASTPWSATASPVTLGGQVLNGVTAIAAGGLYTDDTRRGAGQGGGDCGGTAAQRRAVHRNGPRHHQPTGEPGGESVAERELHRGGLGL